MLQYCNYQTVASIMIRIAKRTWKAVKSLVITAVFIATCTLIGRYTQSTPKSACFNAVIGFMLILLYGTYSVIILACANFIRGEFDSGYSVRILVFSLLLSVAARLPDGAHTVTVYTLDRVSIVMISWVSAAIAHKISCDVYRQFAECEWKERIIVCGM